MEFAISGTSGLIGSALEAYLKARGHGVARLVRSPAGNDRDIYYDVDRQWIDRERLERADVVIHLAGENVGEGRWTEEKKQQILDSRVKTTTLIAEALAGLDQKPKAFICASAIGIYGERGDTLVHEGSSTGDGFLGEVCRAWEAATEPAREAGIHTVNARLGVVITADGGPLAKMKTPFQFGLGGVVGSGKQWMSWISLRDVLAALTFLSVSRPLEGPVNLVAPAPVTNAEFTRELGRALRRPAVLPLPAFAARLALGDERAEALLLSSTRVEPRRLVEAGFCFDDPSVADALEVALGGAQAA